MVIKGQRFSFDFITYISLYHPSALLAGLDAAVISPFLHV
jgi:hypothetical protein